MRKNLLLQTVIIFSLFLLTIQGKAQTPLYSATLVSDVGTTNTLGQANTSRNVAVDASGNIGVVYVGSGGLRFAKSTNRGQSFLPSVQLQSGVTTGDCEVELADNGNIYVIYSNGTIKLYTSLDGGATFTAGATIGSGTAPHIASYGSNVYVVPQPGTPVYRNLSNGVGAFTSVNSANSWAFSDIRVDKANGDVYLIADNPTLFMYKSTNSAASFTAVPVSGAVYYSSYTITTGPLGKFIYVAGGSDNNGYRIDFTTGASTHLTVGTNATAQGRTLTSDEFGNFVDGYAITTSSMGFKVSNDQGATFGAAVSIANSTTHNIARNASTQDIDVVYQGSDGKVYLLVYPGMLKGLTTSGVNSSYCAGATGTANFTFSGSTVNAGNVYTVQLSDSLRSFSSPVNIGTLTSSATTGTINFTIPAGTGSGTKYRIRVISSSPAVNGADNLFDVAINPTPVATITAGGPTTFCTGGSVLLASSTGASYLWSNGATTSSINANTSGSYTVTVGGGCGTFATSSPVTVTVNGPTAMTVGNNSPIVVGGTLNLTSSGATTYSWTGPNSFSSTLQNPSITNVTTAASGVYTVTGTSAGCSASLTTTVSVKTLIGPAGISSGILMWLDASDIDADANAADDPANNASLAIWKDKSGKGNNATTLAGQNNINYVTNQINGKAVAHFTKVSDVLGSVLQASGVDIRATANPQVTMFTVYKQGAHPTITGQGHALWGNDNGNWDRFFYSSWSYTNDGIVSLGPVNPTFVNVTGAGNVGVTQLMTAVYNNGVTNGSNIYFNGGVVNTFTDNTNATDAYTSLRIGSDGDNGDYNGDIAEFIVYNRKLSDCEIQQVNTYLAAKYGVTFTSATISPAGTNNICANGSLTLTASAGTAYQWYKDGTIIPSATSATYSAAISGTYTVAIANAGGCSSTSVGTVVNVNPLPVVPAITGTNSVCAGSTTQLNDATTGGTWTSKNTSFALVSSTGLVTGVAAGIDTVTYTVTTNGCSTTVFSSVLVTALPVATITAVGPTTFCDGGSVLLKSTGSSLGDALNFNGVNQYVNVTPTTSINSLGLSGYTLEAWVYPTDVSGVKSILRKTGDYNLYIIDGSVAGEVWPNGMGNSTFIRTTPVASNVIAPNTWSHVAATWNKTTNTILLYVNGVNVSSSTVTFPVGGTEPLLIGLSNIYNQPFAGKLDEVRIWDTVRSVTDIANSRNSFIASNTPHLAAYYKFDEGSGSITTDATGKGNNGTLINSPAWVVPSDVPVTYSNYLWTPGNATTSTFTATTSGSYTLTVTDVNSCSATSSPVTVTVNPLPTATASATDALCLGASNGTITVTASGGTAPYQYSKDGGSTYQSSNVFVGLAAGSYTIAVKSATTCVSANTVVTIGTTPDVTAPVPNITTLPAITGQCSVSVTTTPTATDNCNGNINGTTNDPLVYTSQGTYTITWTYKDVANNTSTQTQTVVVKDVTAPTITSVSNITTVATSAAGAVVSYTAPVGSDNCAVVSTIRTAGLASGSTFPIGTTTVTYTVTDIAGLSTSTSFNVTVSGVKPSISCPVNMTVPNDAGKCGAVVNFAATETTGIPASTITYSIPSGGFFSLGTTTVTATATNASGTSVCTFNVTVQDKEGPTIVCQAPLTVNATSGRCDAVVQVVTPAVTDNCNVLNLGNALNFDGVNDIAMVASSSAINQTQNQRTVEAWFRVNDKNINNRKQVIWEEGGDTNGLNLYVYNGRLYCGAYSISLGWSGTWFSSTAINSGQWHNAAVVLDATLPSNQLKVYLDGVLFGQGFATALNAHPSANAVGAMSDNAVFHDGVVESPIGNYFGGDIDEIRCWITARTPAQLAANLHTQLTGNEAGLAVYYNFDQGTACGNNAGINTLIDRTATHLNGTMSNFSLANGCTSNWTNGAPVLNSTITLTNSYTGTADASSTYPVGTTHITWTASDVAGNTSTCTQDVTVLDVQPPTIACSQNMTVTATSVAGAVVTYTTPVGTDNCSGVTTAMTAGLASGSVFPIGTTTVTYTATDAANNTAQCSFVVTVVGLAPVINCPSNITVSATAGQCGANVNFAATETTAIPASTITYSVAPNSFFAVGPTTVTATATNAVGTSSCSFTVTITDDEKPTITAAANQTQTADAGDCGAVVRVVGPSTHDNCGVASVTNNYNNTSDASGHYPFGMTTIVWTVTDIHGNTNTTTQTVTITDDEKPTITAAANQTQTADAGDCGAVVRVVGPSTHDNCTVASVTNNYNNTSDASGHYPFGTTTIVWTVTDIHGNTNTAAQTVTITDDEKPVIVNLPHNMTLNALNNNCSTLAGWTKPTATDNCGIASIVSNDAFYEQFGFTLLSVGVNTITYTVTDIHGNQSSASFTVTVVDNQPPIITGCPSNITINAAAGRCDQVVNWNPPTASDNCPGVSLSTDHIQGSTFPVGATTVTYTATDHAGLITTCSFTVTVVDNQPPVLSGVPQNATVECDAVPQAAAVTAADNCVSSVAVLYTETRTDGNCPSRYTLTRTWSATDAAGNTAIATQVITVQDTKAPVLSTAPVNVTVECDAVPTAAILTAVDNCDAAPVVTFVETRTDGNCPSRYTLTRTWTATDACGNASSKTQVITVQDTKAPVLSAAPVNVTVECDAVPTAAILTAVDNCDAAPAVTFVETRTDGNCPSRYTLTRTWTATDACGNASSKTQVITVQDTKAPVLSTAPDNVIVECDAVPTAAILTAVDNCDAAPAVTFVETRTDGNCPSRYTLTRTWTATDACGNASSKTQVITVQDTQAPVLSSAPANTTVECDAVPTAAILTAVDNCDAAPAVTFVETRTDGNCPSRYTLTRTWTATDACGNASSKTQVITVQDTQAPVLSAAPVNVTVECDAVPAAATLTAVDNCDAAPAVTFVETRTDGNCPSRYTLTRTWTATDACGNASSKTQVITVQDTQAPVLSAAPVNTTVECDAVPTAAILTAVDNCDAAPAVTFVETRTDGNCPSRYTLTRTWTATDACGNASSKTQVITVQDTKAPVLSAAPANTTVECDAVPVAATLTAVDNCDAAPAVTFVETRTDGNCPSRYTLTRTWTATDACGNASSKTQVITVQDTQAPVLSAAPVNVTVECDAVPAAATLTAVDNCDAAPAVTFVETRTDGNCPSRYTLTRTWTATDACGNASSKTQVITVQDTKAPVLSAAPANTTVECDAVPVAATLTAVDNCDANPVITYTETRTNGNCPSNYTLTRKWTATDACGNSCSKTQVITVQDTKAPVLSAAPANTTVECDAVPTAAILTAVDNCDAAPAVTFTETRTNGNCPSSYTLTRKWTATDACGNSCSKTQVITVQDTKAPVLSAAPANTTVECDAVPTAAILTAVDNCDAAPVVTFTETRTNGNCINNYTLTRKWTATDACGNSCSKTQVITVQDTKPPVLSAAPANTTVECNAVLAAAVLTATDNCSSAIVSFTETRTNGNCINNYTLTRKWTATDACGNSCSKTQVITVQDTKAPVLSAAPANTTVECNAVPAAAILTATDACGTATVVMTETRVNGNSPGNYTLTRTWTATDQCGNTSSVSQTITVRDTQAPVPTVASLPVLRGDCSVTATAPTAMDNCAGTITATTLNPTSYTAQGTYTITWSYSDGNGNSTSQQQTVIVKDMTPPAPTVAVLPTVTGQCSAVVTTKPTATDACSGVTAAGTTTDPLSYTVQGTYTIHWTYTDNYGNKSYQNQTVTVKDNIAPVPTAATLPTATGQCSAGIVIISGCTDNCICCQNGCHCRADNCNCKSYSSYGSVYNYLLDLWLSYYYGDDYHNCDHDDDDHSNGSNVVYIKTPTATDNCKGTITGTTTDPLTYTTQGTYTIHWNFDDGNGNVSVQTQTVIVKDNVAPVVNSSSLPTVYGTCSATVTNKPTAYDNCKGTITATTVDPLTYSTQGTFTIHWIYNDGNGNTTTQNQTVVISDNIKPVISDVKDVTVNCGTSTLPSVTGTATATDNCGTPAVTYSDVTVGAKTTRTWTATDAAGNTATSTQTITMVDNTKPVITDPADVTINCGSSSLPSVTGTATATDNCSTPTVSYSDNTNGSIITRTWKATDASGNYATSTQTITIVDNVKPVISAPSSVTISCSGSSSPSATGTATATDNCSTPSVTYSDVTSGNTITRTWKATDASGNYATATQTITSADNTAPVIKVPSNTTISCGSSTAPNYCGGSATATDNCSTPTITYSDVTNGSIITRTWKATDAAGNSTTGNQTITIVDNTKPVLTEPNDITINCGGSTLPAATGMATATDNCSAVAITYTDTQSGNVITRTWKATDASGNYDSDVQYITIGSAFTAGVTSVPTNSTYTGGVSTNLYLGYGAQSTTLTMCSLPSSGAPYSYKWTGSYTSMLSSTTAASPVFTPSTFGYYTFSVTVTNKYGCTSTASISICVTDIRVAGTGGAKVYVCHSVSTHGSTTNTTLQVALNLVSSHVGSNSCGGNGNDRLGSCDQSPCNTTVSNSVAGLQSGMTKEGTETTATSEEDLKVTVMPNPTTTFFTLKIESKYDVPVNMRVMDAQGRVIDAKSKIGANSTLQIGHAYSSGTYYAEFIQGGVRKVVQMVKGRG